ncbi:MAG: hypothetical protein KC635_08160, partial [Myxococcales bacterium]|nr:hypothetical protein [Myxococcales bacterium]
MNDQDDRPESPEIRPIPQIPRRALLKQLGGAAAAAALLPRLAACDDEETIPASGADASDAAGASDTAGLAPDTLGADTAAADTGPGPVPALQPLRRDGSHPYDYIDTIVILQMENRSFDHYYGALSLEEGRDDVDGLVAGLTNPDASGAPVGLRRVRDLFTISPDPSHGHVASLEQWADGANDGFVRNWQKKLAADLDDEAERQARLDLVMGWYGRAELPAHYGLADAFTVCDRWFCSLLGPTWPNRFYSHAATSDGLFANLTPLESPTMFRLALDHGLTVGAYYSTLFHFAWTMKNPEPTDYYDQPLEQFFADAEAGTLPNVCIVEPDYAVDDDHPPHDTRLG